MNILPETCFYYPTKTLFVDDQQEFLDSLCLGLPEDFRLSLCTQASEALQLLADYNGQIIDCLKPLIDEDIETDSALALDFSAVHTLIQDPIHYDQYAVVVVDQLMPEMTGMEFCRRLKSHPIKKIMLTGDSDHHLAVQAFNAGIIDHFIQKTEQNLHEVIQCAIEMHQKKYFKDQSRFVLQTIRRLHPDSLMNKPGYVQFVNDLFADNHCSEYYLLDTQGSLLFLDAQKKPHWLLIKSDQELAEYAQIAEGNDASQEVIAALENREQLLFFFSEDDRSKPVSQWAPYLFKASPIIGEQGYFYALQHGEIPIFSVSSQPIMSDNLCCT